MINSCKGQRSLRFRNKYLALIIAMLLFFNAKATNYFVSNAGSDANSGTSSGASWKTISKVNSFSFLPGDIISFNKGDVWNEKFIPSSSGTLANPIIVNSYGSGAMPIITGFQTLGGFTNISGNIWQTTATNSVPYENTVMIAGILRAKGRTPNTGYLTFTGHSGNTQITGSLSGTPNYTGAECVVRTSPWVTDVEQITSQSGGVINFSPGLTYVPTGLGTNGYFIQNVISALDLSGEWCQDSTTKLFTCYSVGSPTVLISTIDTLVEIHGHDYITFDGLDLRGANRVLIDCDTANHVTIQNNSIHDCGANAIAGIKSTRVIVQNDSIYNCLSGAVYLRQYDPYTPMVNVCDSALVDGNYIKNIAIYPGMGLSDNGRYMAVYVVGAAPSITNNRVDSVGYIPLILNGLNGLVYHNYVTNFCFIKEDGGGIYSGIGAYFTAGYDDGTIIRSNIVSGGLGVGAGTTLASQAVGIYGDATPRFLTIDSNTVSNTTLTSCFLYNSNNIKVKDNTFVDSVGVGGIWVTQASSALNFKRNVCYSQSSTQPILNITISNLTFSIDTNYYLRPTLETGKIKMVSTTYDLPVWVANTSYDAHTASTPTGITSALPLFITNPTLSPVVTPLTGNYIDAKGVSYSGSITIQPYQSALLFAAQQYVPTGATRTKGTKNISL